MQTCSTYSNIFQDSINISSIIMQSVVIILFLLVAYVVLLRILAGNYSDVYWSSLSATQLWIVIPYNRDEAIPVVPVRCTFLPIFLNSSAIFLTR